MNNIKQIEGQYRIIGSLHREMFYCVNFDLDQLVRECEQKNCVYIGTIDQLPGYNRINEEFSYLIRDLGRRTFDDIFNYNYPGKDKEVQRTWEFVVIDPKKSAYFNHSEESKVTMLLIPPRELSKFGEEDEFIITDEENHDEHVISILERKNYDYWTLIFLRKNISYRFSFAKRKQFFFRSFAETSTKYEKIDIQNDESFLIDIVEEDIQDYVESLNNKIKEYENKINELKEEVSSILLYSPTQNIMEMINKIETSNGRVFGIILEKPYEDEFPPNLIGIDRILYNEVLSKFKKVRIALFYNVSRNNDGSFRFNTSHCELGGITVDFKDAEINMMIYQNPEQINKPILQGVTYNVAVLVIDKSGIVN
jgi:hypothetical protein